MTTTQRRNVEKKILGWLKAETKPLTTTELLLKHAAAGVSAVELRRAVWGLVDAGQVHFSTDRRIAVAK